MRRILLFGLSGTLLLFACSDESDKPENLISEPVYIDLLAELLLASQLIELQDLFEVEDSLRQVIFDHYGVSGGQFSESHAYYQRDPQQQLVRMDSLRTKLNEEQDALIRHRSELQQRAAP